MILVCCDFCGKVIEKYELKDAWELHKFREGERICCGNCEIEWEKYEKDLRDLEETCAEELSKKKQTLREKYYKLQKDSSVDPSHQSEEESTEKEIPTTIFKTLRKY